MCRHFLLFSSKRLLSYSMILEPSVSLGSFILSLLSLIVCTVFSFSSSHFAYFACFYKSIFSLSMCNFSFTLSRSNNIISLLASNKSLYLSPFSLWWKNERPCHRHFVSRAVRRANLLLPFVCYHMPIPLWHNRLSILHSTLLVAVIQSSRLLGAWASVFL